MRTDFGALRALGSFVAVLLLTLPRAVSAQAPPRAVLIEPVVTGDGDAIAASLQRVVRSRITALEAAELEATPALGLDDLGLATGCVGRTPACLDAVAAQLEVEMLIWLELERSGGTVSYALHSHRRGDEAPRRAERTFSGDSAEAEALDDADGLVRQLFDLPPPPPEAVDPIEPGPAERPTPAAEGTDAVAIALPSALLGAGVLTLVAGLVTGAVAQGSQDEYAELEVARPADVDAALALHDRAAAEATAANVLYVAGGALLAAGATALVISLATAGSDEDEPALSVGPLLGPSTAGVYATARFGGAR